MTIKVLSLFDGISAGFMALTKMGLEFEYHAIEIDKYPSAISKYNFPEIVRWEEDVTKVTKEQLQENGPYDLLLFGFPCQRFSVAGRQTGLEEDKLLLYALKIREWCLELNPNMLYMAENVKMKRELLRQCNSLIGTTPTLINADLVSAQKRERNYWTNFPVTQPEDRGLLLVDVLEEDVPDNMWVHPKGSFKLSDSRVTWGKSQQDRAHHIMQKSTCLVGDRSNNKNIIYDFVDRDKSYCLDASYFKGTTLKEYITKSRRQVVFSFSSSIREGGKKEYRSRVDDTSNTLTTGDGCCGGLKSLTGVAKIESADLLFRKLTVRECARLQTMPDTVDFSIVSNSQAYKAIGNSWCVDVIVHILSCGLSFKEERFL
jgi:site-specific DNA-cytosine methylase